MEGRQSMDKCPRGDSAQVSRFGRAFKLLGETYNDSKTGPRRSLDLGIFASIEAGLKHYGKIIRVISRKAQISHSGLDKLLPQIVRLFNRLMYFALQ